MSLAPTIGTRKSIKPPEEKITTGMEKIIVAHDEV
jgi:hypothetical protein